MSPTQSNVQAVTMAKTASGVPVRVMPNGWRPEPDNLALTVDELTWLDRFRAQLLEDFPQIIEDIIVYGYRARGMADTTLEFKVLVVVSGGHAEAKRIIKELGYDLEAESYAGAYVAVSTVEERAAERQKNSRATYVEEPRVGISVL